MFKLFFALFLSGLSGVLFGQSTQNVRGTLLDIATQAPIYGARIQLRLANDSTQKIQAVSDPDGQYVCTKVPIGKHLMVVQAQGYALKSIPVIVNSGKESIVDIQLEELVAELAEVVVISRKKGEVNNELSTVSSQQFSVAETERYAGSRGDPARMASNFAGVQGADDSRNDIVVRGNSPLGVIYKIEGVDIPNPNHFATSGSTGGPVSIINNKLLGNSDFFLSAFPAEYGNSTSGIFDLKLRSGNNQRHEFSGQFGFLGTEFMAEGPLSKKGKASYLIMGRYSTLKLFQTLGIKIGTDAVPAYGDYGFKFNFPFKGGRSLALWGMGGKSDIEILISQQKEYSSELYGEGDRDQYFGTSMSVTGLTYKRSLKEKWFLQTTLSGAIDEQHSHHNYLIRGIDTNVIDGIPTAQIRVDSIFAIMGYQFKTTRGSLSSSATYKPNKKQLFKFGVTADYLFFNMLDSARASDNSGGYLNFVNRWDYKGGSVLLQPYFQWRYKLNDKMDFTAGIHNQYFSLSKSISLFEPRLGWKYQLNKGNRIFAGAGLHSQTQPNYIYTYHKLNTDGSKRYENITMDFSKSIHTAMGYEKSFNAGFTIRTEVYYQQLYQIPVENKASSMSIINLGSGFARFFPDSLKNTGTGKNYGVELTVQKYFDKSYFILFTGSLYDSKYTGSDNIERNTSYNGTYTFNVLFGKEFKLNEKQSISIGGKYTQAGGRRYGYVDVPRTVATNELVFKDSLFNSRQFNAYSRLDLKINWKLNTKKITHEIGLDLVNILNTKNLLSLAYAPDLANPKKEPIAEKYQLGFLPLFYYRIDFTLSKRAD